MDSFIGQVNAARFTAGHERQFGRILLRRGSLVNARKLENDDSCPFGKGRSTVKHHHTVLNVSWNLHAGIIGEVSAQVKRSLLTGDSTNE